MLTYIIIAIVTVVLALLINEIEDVQEDVAHAKYLRQRFCLRYTANIKVRGRWIIICHGRWSKCWKAARKAAEEVGGAPVWVFPTRR